MVNSNEEDQPYHVNSMKQKRNRYVRVQKPVLGDAQISIIFLPNQNFLSSALTTLYKKRTFFFTQEHFGPWESKHSEHILF